MIKLNRPFRSPATALGFALAGDRLHVVQTGREQGSLRTLKSFTTTLTPELREGAPAEAARALRRELAAADIRGRDCALALSAEYVLGGLTRLPAGLTPEDEAGFLALEAERFLPSDPAQWQVAAVRHAVAGASFISQFAVRRDTAERWSAVLRLAGMRPRSLILGLNTLADGLPNGNALTLVVETNRAAVLVSVAGRPVSQRVLDAFETIPGHEPHLDPGALRRELHLTLEQLPPEIRGELRQLHLWGGAPQVSAAANALSPWAEALALAVIRHDRETDPLPTLVAGRVAGRILTPAVPPGPDFLIPLVHPVRAWLARYNSQRLASAGLIAAAVVVLLGGAFAWLETRAWLLRSEWASIQPQVTTLADTQAHIREYRSWYDNSCLHLQVLRLITDAFPDDGTVTAKTVEIRNGSVVTVTGTMRDNTALLLALERLRGNPRVHELKVDQIRDKTSPQFTFAFRCSDLSGS